MKILDYKEHKAHGSPRFPMALYDVTAQHEQYVMPCHWHEECEIILIQQGTFTYDIDSVHGMARAGDILFVNSGALHAGQPDACAYQCAVFHLDMLTRADGIGHTQLAPFADGDARVSLHLTEDAAIAAVTAQLMDTLTRGSVGHRLQAQGLLYQFFGLIIDHGHFTRPEGEGANRRKLRQLKAALSLIEERYSSAISLAQLAEAAQMSPKYFCHFFRHMTQRTPIDYLNEHRVEVARHRLMMGAQSMTDLAYECGFSDLSYFIRVFKRYTGITPKRYAALAHGEG